MWSLPTAPATENVTGAVSYRVRTGSHWTLRFPGDLVWRHSWVARGSQAPPIPLLQTGIKKAWQRTDPSDKPPGGRTTSLPDWGSRRRAVGSSEGVSLAFFSAVLTSVCPRTGDENWPSTSLSAPTEEGRLEEEDVSPLPDPLTGWRSLGRHRNTVRSIEAMLGAYVGSEIRRYAATEVTQERNAYMKQQNPKRLSSAVYRPSHRLCLRRGESRTVACGRPSYLLLRIKTRTGNASGVGTIESS